MRSRRLPLLTFLLLLQGDFSITDSELTLIYHILLNSNPNMRGLSDEYLQAILVGRLFHEVALGVHPPMSRWVYALTILRSTITKIDTKTAAFNGCCLIRNKVALLYPFG